MPGRLSAQGQQGWPSSLQGHFPDPRRTAWSASAWGSPPPPASWPSFCFAPLGLSFSGPSLTLGFCPGSQAALPALCLGGCLCWGALLEGWRHEDRALLHQVLHCTCGPCARLTLPSSVLSGEGPGGTGGGGLRVGGGASLGRRWGQRGGREGESPSRCKHHLFCSLCQLATRLPPCPRSFPRPGFVASVWCALSTLPCSQGASLGPSQR